MLPSLQFGKIDSLLLSLANYRQTVYFLSDLDRSVNPLPSHAVVTHGGISAAYVHRSPCLFRHNTVVILHRLWDRGPTNSSPHSSVLLPCNTFFRAPSAAYSKESKTTPEEQSLIPLPLWSDLLTSRVPDVSRRV